MRRAKYVVVVAALTVTGVIAGVMNASAWNGCTASRACIFDDNNYINGIGYKFGGDGLTNVGAAANDKMDSWHNRTNRHGAWYRDTNAGGACNSMLSGDSNPNLRTLPSDELSSWRMNGYC